MKPPGVGSATSDSTASIPNPSKSFDSLRLEHDKIEKSSGKDDFVVPSALPYLTALGSKKVAGSGGGVDGPRGLGAVTMEDLAQLALTGVVAAPGHFLSRSEDSLALPSASQASAILANKRQESPKSIQNKPKSNKTLSGLTSNVRTMSSAHLGSSNRVVSCPLVEKSEKSIINDLVADQTDSPYLSSKAPTVSSKDGTSRLLKKQPSTPDPRITRTKMTVTELQKQKKDLEAYVSELVKKAEAKQAELATMKMEIRRLKEEKGEEFEKLALENETLRRQLSKSCVGQRNSSASLENEHDDSIVTCKVLVDVSTSPVPPSSRVVVAGTNAPPVALCRSGSPTSTSDTTGGRCNDDDDDDDEVCDAFVNDNGPSVAMLNAAEESSAVATTVMTSSLTIDGVAGVKSINNNQNICSSGAKIDWDRQSTGSEMSLACLHDRIVQMEETHYSTNEELQATLQELTDLQDTVNDLVQENRQLFEDKTLLCDSLCKQAAKIDNHRLQIENLKHLLLSSTDLCFSRRFGRKSESANAEDSHCGEDDVDQEELQQNGRLLEILKNTHEDYEDLLKKYENLRFSYKNSDDERCEYKKLADQFSERCASVERRCDRFQADGRANDERADGLNRKLAECQKDVHKFSNFYDTEKKKCDDLQRLLSDVQRGAETDVQLTLKRLGEQRHSLEDKVTCLENVVSSKNADLELASKKLSDLQKTLDDLRRSDADVFSSKETTLRRLQTENISLRDQIFELKKVAVDLTRSCERHAEDKKGLQNETSNLRECCSTLRSDNEKLAKEFTETRAQRERDLEDWCQFQADLQIAVVVANDFKVEAQEELEKLSFQNKDLLDKISNLTCEVEKLRCAELENRRLSHAQRRINSLTPSPLKNHPLLLSPDVKSRMNGYLSSVESSTSTSPGVPLTARQRLVTSQNPSKCVLSVRALVESLESATTSSTVVGHQRRHCLGGGSNGAVNRLVTPLRSPGAIAGGQSDAVGVDKASASPGGVNVGLKRNGVRPVSLESIDAPSTSSLSEIISPKQQTVKTASTECNALSGGLLLRGSPLKLPTTLNSSDGKPTSSSSNFTGVELTPNCSVKVGGGNESFNGGATVMTSSSKSILKNQNPVPHQHQRQSRKSSYLDLENQDPFTRLMKDAPRGSRRNALLRWCQNRTAGYQNVEITNFSSSWNDGLAFCALIHSFAPDKIPLDSMDVHDKTRNFTLAFKTAESLGIPATLSVDEMVCFERPNWQAVMTYVTSIFTRFELN